MGSTTSSTTTPRSELTVDWTARTVEGGSSLLGVEFCEGDAPLLCISTEDGIALGVIEHLEADPVDDLEAFAADFARSMRQDRIEGCDPAFELQRDEARPSTLFGADAVRYGYTGSIDGRLVERVVGHAANVEGRLHLIVVNLLADDGCLARESELPMRFAEAAELVLDEIVAGSVR